MNISALEICAGGGGQALGLELAGFACAAAIEIDGASCATLRLNRPDWRVINRDIRDLRLEESAFAFDFVSETCFRISI